MKKRNTQINLNKNRIHFYYSATDKTVAFFIIHTMVWNAVVSPQRLSDRDLYLHDVAEDAAARRERYLS
jgi:hypothetical protein